MSDPIDSMDENFKVLRSRGAVMSDSFSQNLEDRLMLEQQKQLDIARKRPKLWLALAGLVALSSLATVGYATDGFSNWGWNVKVGDDGSVKDKAGNVVGKTVEHADGSSTIFIHTGPNTGIMMESPASMKGQQIEIGGTPYSGPVSDYELPTAPSTVEPNK